MLHNAVFLCLWDTVLLCSPHWPQNLFPGLWLLIVGLWVYSITVLADIFFVLFFYVSVLCACMCVCMFTGVLTRRRACEYEDQGLALDVFLYWSMLYILRRTLNTECTDLVTLAGIPISAKHRCDGGLSHYVSNGKSYSSLHTSTTTTLSPELSPQSPLLICFLSWDST